MQISRNSTHSRRLWSSGGDAAILLSPRIQVFDYPTDTEPGNAFSSIFTGMGRVRNAANNSKEIAGRALLVSGGLARAVNRGL